MCGRFTLYTPAEEIGQLFDVDPEPAAILGPRFNIAPTQPVLAVRAGSNASNASNASNEEDAAVPDGLVLPSREMAILQWGLVPSWAKDPGMGARMINARSETAAEKPAFRAAFKRRRCLVPADGFYEWRTMEGRKQPYFIHMRDRRPFAIAGLWERWQAPDGSPLESCSLLTTEANARVSPLHDRMPVILAPGDWALWLDPEVESAPLLQPLMRPFDAAAMDAFPVSTQVNAVRNDAPELVEAIVLSEQPRLI